MAQLNASMTIAALNAQLLKLRDDFEINKQLVAINTDAFFLVTMSIIVFIMQCGFAFVEAGSVRSKNTINILLKNLLTSLIACIVYFFVGWAFAFGANGNRFCGLGQFLLIDLPAPKYPLWFFHFVFAATASTIVSGAVAERCEMFAFLCYTVLLTGFVYPVITHWTWDSTGWLANGPEGLKFRDFAGSGGVHLHGGTVALIGMIFLGPRLGRFPCKKTGRPAIPLKGHSAPFVVLGGFMLLFGFFGFNGGSQGSLALPGAGDIVARACVNTILCSGWSTVAVLFCNKFLFSKTWSLLCSVNAALAGMVAACSGCDVLEPWACSVVGIGAGLAYFFVAMLVEKLEIDDPVDTVGIHCGGGFWGLVITPIMMNGGIIYDFNRLTLLQLGWNVLGGVAIIAWSLLVMGALFLVLKLTGMLRVPEEVELKGLDFHKHGAAAYPTNAYGSGWVDPEHAISKPASRKISTFCEDPHFLTAEAPINSTIIINKNDLAPEDGGRHTNYDNPAFKDGARGRFKNGPSGAGGPVRIDQGESVSVATSKNYPK